MTMECSWSDLPEDLLHLVYVRVVGMLQRVHFAAVCTSWRDAAIHAEAPPAIPCHISSFGGKRDRTKRMYCPEDGEVLVVPVPSKATVRRFVGAHDGGWIAALTHKHVRLVIGNVFSGVEVPLSVKQRKFVPTSYCDKPCTIKKIVFSKTPTSGDCILAALTYSSSGVALCRVGCPEDDWWIMKQEQLRFDDITFCNGQLYGLTTDKELFRFNITSKDSATSVGITRMLSVQCASSAPYRQHPFDLGNLANRTHLFVMGGKLAMASISWYTNMSTLFKVFELTYNRQGKPLKWAEVTSLGEHALFLGGTCSTSVRVPVGGGGRVETNCIYTANPLYFSQENERCGESMRRIKVVHTSQNGTWLIPPRV